MANRIKGITIEIDGNTTKLSKALEGVNKDIKNTQSSLRDVEKLLQMDPGNMDLLKQKQDLLGKSVTLTKEKLDTLKSALAEMDAKGADKASAEYQGLQREIASTEQYLKDAEANAKTFNATLAKVSASADNVAEKANKVASATKGISTAAAGALGGLIALGVKAGADADELNTLAKQTGLSTESLQKMQYASELVDVSVDDITGAVKKMKKSLDSSADTFDQIGVAVKDANGEYRSTEDIFYDTVEALGNIENETERDIIAMDIFGKSADELAGILDDGGQALKDLGDEAANKGLIISQEDLDQANEMNDTLDELKATLGGSFGKAAVSALTALTPVLESVAGAVEKVAGFISNLSPQTLQIITIILAVVAAISPVASLIAGIATAISTIMPIIAALNAVLAANPVVLIIMAIIAAVALLIAAGVAIYKNWDEIKAKAQELWGALVEKFTAIKDAVVEKFNAIKETVSGAFDNIKSKASEKWNQIKEVTGTVLGAVKETASEKLGAMKKAFEENGGGFKGAMAAAWEGIKGYFTAGFSVINKLTGGKLGEIKDKFVAKFNEIIESAKNWGKDLIDNFVQGIKDKIQAVKDTFTNIAEIIKDFIGFSEPEKGPLSNFHTFAPDLIDLFTKGLTDNLYKVDDAMTQMASRLVPEQSINVNYNDSALTGTLNSLGATLQNGVQSNVTVVLEGDAKGVFKLVREQNNINTRATGRNALA